MKNIIKRWTNVNNCNVNAIASKLNEKKKHQKINMNEHENRKKQPHNFI